MSMLSVCNYDTPFSIDRLTYWKNKSGGKHALTHAMIPKTRASFTRCSRLHACHLVPAGNHSQCAKQYMRIYCAAAPHKPRLTLDKTDQSRRSFSTGMFLSAATSHHINRSSLSTNTQFIPTSLLPQQHNGITQTQLYQKTN